MEEVEGIILILSCQKYIKKRLDKFKLKNKNYCNWKVIYVIGDLFMKKNYELKDDNMLYIKCEDSYIHLLKKLVLSIKYLNEIFIIKQGILRCGDDLIFSESSLIKFLNNEKHDYYGQATYDEEGIYSLNDIISLKEDNFMYDYYVNHTEDFNNKHHGLSDLTIEKVKSMSLRPDIKYGYGIVFYISNYACKILIDHMEKINYNLFHFDTESKSYPYTIEDVGVGYILQIHKIEFVNKHIFFGKRAKFIARHTNYGK